MTLRRYLFFFFFFNDTATTEIYTLSLHDALPIFHSRAALHTVDNDGQGNRFGNRADRKSTRLNSSHTVISYAVFCLKKKNDLLRQRPLLLLLPDRRAFLGPPRALHLHAHRRHQLR